MRIRVLLALAITASASAAHAVDGLVEVESAYGVPETMDRLQELVEQRGLTVFARIDHAAGAAKIGTSMRPTQLLIFGNPQGGTPFMTCAQTVGIDLPLKALVWQDADARVWVGYNDPAFVAARHGVEDCPVVDNLERALTSLVAAAVAR